MMETAPKMMSSRLSEKHKALAEYKVQGLTDHEACLKAGFKPSSNQAASKTVRRLFTNEHFCQYVDELRSKSSSNAVKSAQEVKEQLSSLMDLAASNEDFSGYTQLANRLAKMSGHDEPEKKEVSLVDSFFDQVKSKTGIQNEV